MFRLYAATIYGAKLFVSNNHLFIQNDIINRPVTWLYRRSAISTILDSIWNDSFFLLFIHRHSWIDCWLIFLGVGIINASPLSMGLLSVRGPPDWHPARQFCPEVTAACKAAALYCDERGVNISRLALHFSLQQPDCTTCLVSTASRANAGKNLDVVCTPLNDAEQQVLAEVMEKYMKPLNNAHWEREEVQQYWDSLRL